MINKAKKYSEEKHKGQKRKWTGDAYYTHPLAVYNIVRCYTDDEDTQVAALLHDTIEDCGVSAKDLNEEFNDEVAHIVWMLSHQEETKGWLNKRVEYIQRISNGDVKNQAILVALADKLHNTLSIREAFKEELYDGTHDIQKAIWFNTSMIILAGEMKLKACDALIEELNEATVWLEWLRDNNY